ncbi:hypothetical protein [Streptococcus porcinus]|uniref:Secreted protein n=1 Tax=Streptococcus porcinus TaxID=1340 RepID=A0A7V9WQI6_STRPO|nr:hypothetical protein [Streptococcus porcinus]MBA2795235.1 hypothetical protein [Streptococcus porcinus]
MSKILKTTAVTLLASVMLNTSLHSVLADQVPDSKIELDAMRPKKIIPISDLSGNLTLPKPDNKMLEKAKILEGHFYVKRRGAVGLKGDPKELATLLGISETDVQLYFEAVQELPNVYMKGPVGIRFNLGPKVRSMSGWAAGTFAAAYAGWHLKQFAVNPATAGFTAVISGAIGWAVKTAVESHKKTTLAVVYIPGVDLVYTVNVP